MAPRRCRCLTLPETWSVISTPRPTRKSHRMWPTTKMQEMTMNGMKLIARGLGSPLFIARAALLVAAGWVVQPAVAQMAPPPAVMVDDPIPHRTEGAGPFKRLILRGAYMIDGTGAPAQGPIDMVVEGNRIKEIKLVGAPGRIE